MQVRGKDKDLEKPQGMNGPCATFAVPRRRDLTSPRPKLGWIPFTAAAGYLESPASLLADQERADQ